MRPYDARVTAIESVAVVGSGAMGAMYAAHLAAAGVPVRLVARGPRAVRLRQGLTVNGERLTAEVVDADAADGLPPAGLVLVAVKHAHLDAAIEDVRCVVGPETTFLSVLNGLDSEERLAAAFAPEQVLLANALAMDARRVGDAITYRQAGRIVFGPAEPGTQGERVQAVRDLLDRAGLAWETPDDMRHAMWWKFMVNVGVNQASALTRRGYGAFVDDGPCRLLMRALMDEVIAVGRAEGVDLGDADLARWDAVLAAQPADGWTSMHQDAEAGRPTEVDAFAGHVVALGERHGIPTPYNRAALWALRGLAEGADDLGT